MARFYYWPLDRKRPEPQPVITADGYELWPVKYPYGSSQAKQAWFYTIESCAGYAEDVAFQMLRIAEDLWLTGSWGLDAHKVQQTYREFNGFELTVETTPMHVFESVLGNLAVSVYNRGYYRSWSMIGPNTARTGGQLKTLWLFPTKSEADWPAAHHIELMEYHAKNGHEMIYALRDYLYDKYVYPFCAKKGKHLQELRQGGANESQTTEK
jgi:hypothetical protein